MIKERNSLLALYNEIQSKKNNSPKQTPGIPISTLITQ